MKVSEIPEDKIHIGMKIKSLVSDHIGTVISKEVSGDEVYWFVKFNHKEQATSGFYWNHSQNEVVYCEGIVNEPNTK
jgi:hypothetical protein